MKRFLLAFACISYLIVSASADSPLTSTDFHKAYLNNPHVIAAHSGELTEPMLHFLDDEDVPLDQKLALVNALGWRFNEDQGFTEIYADHLIEKNGLRDESIYRQLSALPSDEIAILCYFDALGHYLDDEVLLKLKGVIEYAVEKDDQCYSTQLVAVLIRGQLKLHRKLIHHSIWQDLNDLERQSGLKNPISSEAYAVIRDYLKLYP